MFKNPLHEKADFLFFMIYPPSQNTMGVSPWMNAECGSSETRRAKEDASDFGELSRTADSAEEMEDTTGVSPWRLHLFPNCEIGECEIRCKDKPVIDNPARHYEYFWRNFYGGLKNFHEDDKEERKVIKNKTVSVLPIP